MAMHPSLRRRPKTVSTRILGLPVLLEELLGEPIGYYVREEYKAHLVDVAKLYDECSRLGDQFTIVVRETLDRLQQFSSLTTFALYNGREYAVTADIVLDRTDGVTRVTMLKLLLERQKELLVEHDEKKAISPGADPVPVVFRTTDNGLLYIAS